MSYPTATRERHTTFATFAQNRPVAAFFLLALPLSTLFSALMIMVEYEVLPGRSIPPLIGLDTELAASLLLTATLAGSALIVTYLGAGQQATQVLLRRAFRWRVPLRWWLAAVVALPAVTIPTALVLGDDFVRPSASVLATELVSLLVALFVINVWEELAWSGFLQTRLERRHTIVFAAVLTSAPFAFVHMPLRIITGEATTVGELAVSFTVLFLFGFFFRTALAAVMRGALNSVLLAATMHTLFNRSNNVDGLVADMLTGPNRQVAAPLATLIVTVGVLLMAGRKLSRSYRLVLDAAEPR